MNWLKWGLLAALIAGAGLIGFRIADSAGDARLARAQAAYAGERLEIATEAAFAESSARISDQVKAKALNDIAAQHERDKANAQKDQDRLVADIRAGTVRLRDEWATCRATSKVLVAAGASQSDAAPRDRAESVGRILRAARDADDTIRALQATLTKERE